MRGSQRKRLLAPLVLFMPAPFAAQPARTQDRWPAQPIRLIVPFPPGGSSSLPNLASSATRSTASNRPPAIGIRDN